MLSERKADCKAYTLFYWMCNDGDQDGHFKSVDCLIDENEINKLKQHEAPKMIEIIVNDGEKMYIQVDNINRIEEVF